MVDQPTDHPALIGWAERSSESWCLDRAGQDRLVVDGLPIRWPLRVEVYNVLRSLALARLGRRDVVAGPPLGGFLKRRGLDRKVHASLLRGSRTASLTDLAKRTDRPVIFVSEMAVASTIEPSLAVAAALPADMVVPLVADRRAARAWRQAGYEPSALLLPWRRDREIRTQAARRLSLAWRERFLDMPPIELAGMDVRADVHRALAPLVLRGGPWLWSELSALALALRRVAPRAVVVATDQHRVGWLAARAARSASVPTFVLQHGLPQAPIGYVPVVADRVVAWSDASRDWFVDHGTPAERVVVAGNPRLDGLTTDLDDAATAWPWPNGQASPRLLLALSPTSLSSNERLLTLALAAVERLPSARLVIKTHPGSGDWRFVAEATRRLAPSVAARVRVAQREPLPPLLRWATLTMVLRTTVAVESLAAGTPVAAAAIGVPSVADTDMRSAELPTFDSPDTLVKLARELAGPEARERFMDERRAAIETITGPTDGASARRIADLLMTGSGLVVGDELPP